MTRLATITGKDCHRRGQTGRVLVQSRGSVIMEFDNPPGTEEYPREVVTMGHEYLPPGWTEAYTDTKMRFLAITDDGVARGTMSVSVTVDLVRRCYRGGCGVQDGVPVSTGNYSGRNWRNKLLTEAVQWLKSVADPTPPPCVQSMRCLCAAHARGVLASEPCDTREPTDHTRITEDQIRALLATGGRVVTERVRAAAATALRPGTPADVLHKARRICADAYNHTLPKGRP